jgi:hypothetical protein
MWQDLVSSWNDMQSSLGLGQSLIALAFSIVFTLVIYFMYQAFYGSKHIGAGVHRMFFLGGPAITVLFLGIQTSIPLSLGLLGALSFVRFRTPVKDPAEIGFLLLLIASSIGAATGNFMVIGLLLLTAFVLLGVRWSLLDREKIAGGQPVGLMISLDQADFNETQAKIQELLADRVKGRLKLQSMSMVDGKVNLQYQYRHIASLDWPTLTREMNEAVSPAKLDIFVG